MPPPSNHDSALLVIGYGNTLRQDDQAGPMVADIISQYDLPGVRTLACAQLSPEHAAAVARAAEVVFVDAQAGITGPIHLTAVAPGDSAQVTTHAVEPPTLLALARSVYGRSPPAWLLTVHAEKFGFGQDMSATTRKGILAAVYKVLDLSRRPGRAEITPAVKSCPGWGSNPQDIAVGRF